MRKPREDAERNRAACIELAVKERLMARDIAKKLQLHINSVYRILSAAGIEPASPRDLAPLSSKKRVLRMVAKYGFAKASRRLKVSRQAVYVRVQRWLAESE